VESWSEHCLNEDGGKPSEPPLDFALSLQIARLTNTNENMALLMHVLKTGGVEKTDICSLSVVGLNIGVKIFCSNSALRVGSINIDPSMDLCGPIGLLLVN